MASEAPENKKIILCPNMESDAGLKMTLKAGDILRKCGKQVIICPVFSDDYSFLGIGVSGGEKPEIEFSQLENELPSAEMIVTFGGDGTILRAARAAADPGIPILGLNMGGKGFIAELETDEIGLLNTVAAGGYTIENRMMLDVVVMRNGGPVYRDYALNDVVVKGDNKVIDLTLFGDGQEISHFSGDGAVVATPTGSTAYSMAAGGPIVEPSAHNIIITPICAHILDAKSFVLVSDRKVSIEIGWRKHNPAFISVDGGDRVQIQSGDVVAVSKSERYTRLVRLSDRSFYRKVSEKLGERE